MARGDHRPDRIVSLSRGKNEGLFVDRRRVGHIRLPVRLPVMVEEKDSATELPAFGETDNLSRSGVLLRLWRSVRPGRTVCVTLRLRRAYSLTLLGNVVWTRQHPPGWMQGAQFGEALPDSFVTQVAEEDFLPRPGRFR